MRLILIFLLSCSFCNPSNLSTIELYPPKEEMLAQNFIDRANYMKKKLFLGSKEDLSLLTSSLLMRIIYFLTAFSITFSNSKNLFFITFCNLGNQRNRRTCSSKTRNWRKEKKYGSLFIYFMQTESQAYSLWFSIFNFNNWIKMD